MDADPPMFFFPKTSQEPILFIIYHAQPFFRSYMRRNINPPHNGCSAKEANGGKTHRDFFPDPFNEIELTALDRPWGNPARVLKADRLPLFSSTGPP